MSSPDSPSLAIERSARSHNTVIAAVFLILCVTPWWLPGISLWFAALLVTLGVVWAAMAFFFAGWLGGKRAVQGVVWTTDGDWQLLGPEGVWSTATLHPGSRVLGPILWLRFRGEFGARDLLFFGNALAPTIRRKWVVRLRLQGAAGSSPPDTAKEKIGQTVSVSRFT